MKRLPPYEDKWILIRLICASFLLVDVVSFLITRQPLRYARALIPVIYIARRNSMRQMVHGLMLSFGKRFHWHSILSGPSASVLELPGICYIPGCGFARW